MSTNAQSPQLVWLITGTTSGFGKRLVTTVLERGDKVIATARSEVKLNETYLPLQANPNLRLLPLDIKSGAKTIKETVDNACQIWGRIDCLVNNAGNGYLGLSEEAGVSLIREQFETNVFGVMETTHAVLPHMRSRKSGTIITVSSRSIWRSEVTPGIGIYAASKAAVKTLTESLAIEVKPFGIRILIVCPGSFRTEGMYSIPFFTENNIEDYDTTRKNAISAYQSIPGKEPGNPVKAMSALVDIVKGTGVAEGKSFPWILLLGQDAENDLRSRWARHSKNLEVWGEVTRNVGFDEE